jgi:hypothetical protein
MTDLEICHDLMKNHKKRYVRAKCMLIELRLVENAKVDTDILQEIRKIYADGEFPRLDINKKNKVC